MPVHEIAAAVADRLDAAVTGVEPLDGGLIGDVFRVDLADDRRVVAKRGHTPLSLEAAMLRSLDEHGLPVPAVLAADDDLLVLEYVEGDADPSPAAERAIADDLAAVHGHTADAYGFERDTLLGPCPLPNPWTDSWIDFFRTHRLSYFRDRALDASAIDDRASERIDALAVDLDAILTEPGAPALLHGDCWRENVLVREGTVAAFLDPACYYGHPEAELAYVDWTEAYGEPFFERYRERRGIDPGFDERKRVYAVPRLLVHAALFGEPYPQRLAATLSELGY